MGRARDCARRDEDGGADAKAEDGGQGEEAEPDAETGCPLGRGGERLASRLDGAMSSRPNGSADPERG